MTPPTSTAPRSQPNDDVREALRLLGKKQLVLAIHDPSFPSADGEETGRGTPYSRGGHDFLAFAARLGFTGIQLGPQGQTCRINQSPYDGTVFSKNPLSVALAPLAHAPRFGGVLPRDSFEFMVAGRRRLGGDRVQYGFVYDTQRDLLREAWNGFSARRASDPALRELSAELVRFRARAAEWLERDGLYEALLVEHHGAHFRHWKLRGESRLDDRLFHPPAGEEEACAARIDELRRRHAQLLGLYEFTQFLLDLQHREFRAHAYGLGLKLFADLQIGMSAHDAWGRAALFLKNYRLGAPPSRTNPAGQPWNHAVLDPAQYLAADGGLGPALAFVRARVEKAFAEFDGLRVDHPHGLVCPWVYRADDPDSLTAVQQGARLFESPDLPGHPELARYAIATRAQLTTDPATPRHADGWVRELTESQVERYSRVIDVIVEAARAHGRESGDILCEVLSTQPHPLARVMARHGLGRFRVTQKANLDDARDVYRSENAEPADWIMVGNHDTAPIWKLADQWRDSGAARAQAEYLAARLCPDGGREGLAAELAAHPGKLVEAKFADLFASRAENVMVFFADLLGIKEAYNVPGTVSAANWTLRVPADYEREYGRRVGERTALDLRRALALAMRSRGELFVRRHAELVARLEAGG